MLVRIQSWAVTSIDDLRSTLVVLSSIGPLGNGRLNMEIGPGEKLAKAIEESMTKPQTILGWRLLPLPHSQPVAKTVSLVSQ